MHCKAYPSYQTTLQCTENAYISLDILRWFPVVSTQSTILSPLENAIESMSQTNEDLQDLLRKYLQDLNQPLNSLTRKLQGVIDAAVNGGTKNYEKAFLHDGYTDSHPEDTKKQEKLKDLLAEQVPLLEAGLVVHSTRVSAQMEGLHSHLSKMFEQMKINVHRKYGEMELPPDLHVLVHEFQARVEAAAVTGGHSARSSQHYLSTTPSVAYESFNSHGSLSRLSMAKGGTLPRGLKISSVMSNGGTPKSNKKEKPFSRLLRRESFTSQQPSTQWFDKPDSSQTPPPQQPIMELNEQLTVLRPRRTDFDMDRYYTTRPRSLTLTPTTPTTSSLGSRESLSTPEVSPCEEDQPPPLPMKQRDQDGDFRTSVVSLPPEVKDLPEFSVDDLPDEPPPEKPPRPDKNHNLRVTSTSSNSSSSSSSLL